MTAQECSHDGGNWFDRSLCAEPCGSMHTRCSDCGAALGGCHWETDEGRREAYRNVAPLDAAWQEAEAALPEGWRLTALTHAITEPKATRYKARAVGPWHDFAWHDFAWRRARSCLIGGPTPAAALRNLAERLRSHPVPGRK